MRFQIEVLLARPGTCIARRLEDAPPMAQWALLGERMIRSVKLPKAERPDLYAFELDLDPEAPAPTVGEVLELSLLDE